MGAIIMTNSTDLADDNSKLEFKMPMLTAKYFNVEVGSWEPLLEQMTVHADIIQTISQKTMIINFPRPISVNITQQCLANFIYTHKAWMSTPDFHKTLN
jgi:hypothetical protein